MWKAAGKPYNKRPNNFTRSEQAKQLIDYLDKVRSEKFSLLKIVRGRGKSQGTYAHWQIALAYAKYLSPKFHAWANEVLIERFEEEADPDVT